MKYIAEKVFEIPNTPPLRFYNIFAISVGNSYKRFASEDPGNVRLEVLPFLLSHVVNIISWHTVPGV